MPLKQKPDFEQECAFKVGIQPCVSYPNRITLLIPLMKWGHEKDPHEGRLILQSGAGHGLWAGSTKKAPGSDLWPKTIARWGEQSLVICCLGPGVLQILAEGHLLVRALTNDRFLEAAWRLRFSTSSWWQFLPY